VTSLAHRQKPQKVESSEELNVNPGNLQASLKTPSISSHVTDSEPELTNTPGFRAAEAYVRPSSVATAGKILSHGFDLRTCVFSMTLHADKAGSEHHPTEISLPEFHFPKDKCEVEISSGKWTISTDDAEGNLIQRLKWWHVEGQHQIKITGVQRQHNAALGNEDEDGYLDQCQQSKCNMM